MPAAKSPPRRPEPQQSLRRRMNVLERASSFGSAGVPVRIASSRGDRSRERRQQDGDDEILPLTRSTSGQPVKIEFEDDPGGGGHGGQGSMLPTPSPSPTPSPPRQRPTIDTKVDHRTIAQHHSSSPRTSPLSPHTHERRRARPAHKAWYEFDSVVLAALVSPIGNWLTGGDHIKNLLLILFLVFYLHQIIEVPWSLYLNARPRRHPSNLPASPTSLSSTVEGESPTLPPPPSPHAQSASYRLRFLEFFFLALSVASPFLGCLLLQYITSTIMGPDTLSWFSSGLFVLATGIRPWRHIVERIGGGEEALHDQVHYPPPSPSVDADRGMSREEKEELYAHVDDLERKMEAMEKMMVKMKLKIGRELDEICDRVDDSLSTMTKNMRRQEARVERCEVRVGSLEGELRGDAKRGRGRNKSRWDSGASALSTLFDGSDGMLGYMLPQWLYSSASDRHRRLYKMANGGVGGRDKSASANANGRYSSKTRPLEHYEDSRSRSGSRVREQTSRRSQSIPPFLVTPSSRTLRPEFGREREKLTRDELDTMASTIEVDGDADVGDDVEDYGHRKVQVDAHRKSKVDQGQKLRATGLKKSRVESRGIGRAIAGVVETVTGGVSSMVHVLGWCVFVWPVRAILGRVFGVGVGRK